MVVWFEGEIVYVGVVEVGLVVVGVGFGVVDFDVIVIGYID